MSIGDLASITAAISWWKRVLTDMPADHPDRAEILSNLGFFLRVRFERSGVQADLEEAVRAGWAAVQATPADHPDRAGRLANLGSALQTRFKRVGAQADLEEAVAVGRKAVEAAPADNPHRAMCLSNLCGALQVLFKRVGVRADLDEAVKVGWEAVQITPADHPDRALRLSNLGSALGARFERSGVQTDLEKAVTAGREAVQATPADHPTRAGQLHNLGITLRIWFERVGAQADLDEAVAVGREAVEAAPADHPDRAMYLSHLGVALRVRFERAGAQADLDEAITAGREAVQVTPTDHPDRAMYLSNLGVALWARSGRVGAQADLDKAITVIHQAKEAAPAGHPKRAMYLSNLGLALRGRFMRVGGQADLDKAIMAGREAVQVIPADHPDRAVYLSKLGLALRGRFERADAQADLDEAISMHRGSVQAAPADHPDRALYLLNLGLALQGRFERAGAQADLDESITTYVQATEGVSGAPSARIHAARSAASLAAQTDTKRAAGLLETAVRLLPETASRRLDRGDQQYALGAFADLASDAAALALADEADATGGSAVRALRLLELGRGVMLSQALDTRSDLTDLQARHPTLAQRFIELSDQLDQAGDTSVLADDAGMAAAWEERRIEGRHQLAAAFNTTVAEIRGLDGFETFLLPPEPNQLINHAERGPVVVINVSRYRSDAILLRSDGITSIPLPDLAQSALIGRINSFQHALGTVDDPMAEDTLSAVLEWLWDAAARPILDELGFQRIPVPGTVWPRVWWVPVGRLGLLPLHAAGYHRERPVGDGHRTVMDRVISSYTPTVRALGYARERDTASAAGERALIVAMPTTPTTPRDSPLHHVAEEAELLRKRLPGSTLLIEDPATTNANLPTRATVLAHLGDCAIAHFACHGKSNLVDPSQSLLLLHDHDSDPLTVASLAPIRLDQARLAYLSACQTAFNPSTELADEAIHLTTAFQLAGYPHVVGTLWEIDDARAVRVADAFYTALATGDNTIDTRGAAQALHHAVRAIRDELPVTPSLWAAYLHAGA